MQQFKTGQQEMQKMLEKPANLDYYKRGLSQFVIEGKLLYANLKPRRLSRVRI